MYCLSTYVPEKCLLMLMFLPYAPKEELNWTHAIRPVIAKSLRFSKIAKKLNIDLCHFFSHRNEALFLLKS